MASMSCSIVCFALSDVITTRDPVIVTDQEDRIIAVLAGQPTSDESFGQVIAGVEAAMSIVAPTIRARGCGNCRDQDWVKQCRKCRERRGDFKAISVGVSYGGGQTVRSRF